MRRLSFIEVLALVFAAIAGLAASVQAYVSWVARDEVARAIIFSERIDACADMIAAIDFVARKARPEARDRLLASDRQTFFRPEYFLGFSAVRSDPAAVHRTAETRFQEASAAFRIVMPQELEEPTDFLAVVIQDEVLLGGEVSREDFIAYLEVIDENAKRITDACRALA